MLSLKKVISGGQTGADEAGLYTAKKFGFQTGGCIPKGYRTLSGPRPEFGVKYGLSELSSDSYSARTIQNVKNSDGTVRLAANFDSRGELCTLNAIKTYSKPYFDVDLTDLPSAELFADWLEKNKISVLNVAGNSEQTYSGCFSKCVKYLTETFFVLGLEMSLTDDEILEMIGLDTRSMIVYTSDRKLVDKITIRKIGTKR